MTNETLRPTASAMTVSRDERLGDLSTRRQQRRERFHARRAVEARWKQVARALSRRKQGFESPSRLLKMQLKWALASGWRCLRV